METVAATNTTSQCYALLLASLFKVAIHTGAWGGRQGGTAAGGTAGGKTAQQGFSLEFTCTLHNHFRRLCRVFAFCVAPHFVEMSLLFCADAACRYLPANVIFGDQPTPYCWDW